ncbi:hypothetical protein K458DRAFT_381368 [Lentithecium fluviatile CBS 122367]|uniref:SMP-LTD domain-containing protein n=1 Tax=Lentithecium fluviatile CBS 122367 TaxID=1168545 RepID=A0A6G1JN14_9PLEO|nr:hypothetical protein K458DRAFT_381368 [Lentithecium fluviatile CBS 122367]
MASLYFLIAIYVFGGITFLPLLLGLFLCYSYLNRVFRQPPTETDRNRVITASEPREELQLLPSAFDTTRFSDESKAPPHLPDVAAGYFAVCREYVPGGTNGKPPERVTPAGTVVAVESPSVYQTMYRTIFERGKGSIPSMDANLGRSRRGRNVFYVVLRHGHLMLYEDSEQLEVRHVISLANYDVDIYAGGGAIPEGELWIKRNCIRLTQRPKHDGIQPESRPYYIFSENSSDKEDFYHALLQNQETPTIPHQSGLRALRFDMPDLVSLVQQLHASEENLHARWINALIGRLFLALYKTAHVEEFIWTKVNKKIARVPKPAFISSINVQKIDMGNLPPFITNPRLKELTMEGDLIIKADVSYKGNFRLDISAIARVELGTRFKAREVSIVLASILRKLDGHILLRIKPPPSNRLWVTFETAPKMELSLEPIVSTRQITYGVILRAIESRIREVVNETLVFPNWDDIPFCDTSSQEVRGGTWDASSKPAPASNSGETSTAEALQAEESEQFLGRPRSEFGSLSEDDAPKSIPNPSTADVATPKSVMQSSPGLDTDGLVSSSSAELWSGAKPKAVRSGSFSRVANPLVDTNTANAFATSADDHGHQSDAIATIKTAITKSPPVTPSQLPHLSLHHPTGSPTLSVGSVFEALEHGSSRETPDVPPTSHNAQARGDRRPAFNQSFSTATAVAKKWLTPRQTAGLPPSSVRENATDDRSSWDNESKIGDDEEDGGSASHAPANHSLESGHQMSPIGRGRPLPPPGTPLPPPPKPEKRNIWTTSTLANLTRRKPFPAKELLQPSLDDSSHYRPRSAVFLRDINSSTGEHGKPVRQTPPHKPSKTSSISNLAQSKLQEVPPTLPKRRQRLSVTSEPNDRTPHVDILVVEAPSQEGSAPSSPKELKENIGDKGKAWVSTDRHEMIIPFADGEA